MNISSLSIVGAVLFCLDNRDNLSAPEVPPPPLLAPPPSKQKKVASRSWILIHA